MVFIRQYHLPLLPQEIMVPASACQRHQQTYDQGTETKSGTAQCCHPISTSSFSPTRPD